MLEMKTYYRAFREYREKMADDAVHGALMKALLADANASEGVQDKLSRCEWDEDWISAMLDALPYVERALAEQRKFIVSNEEIRRIDQAKKTTVESVRHLAQHSNMISNVQGEDIIPDRVLIVERDDNYFIYENRFLYTLVHRMQTFLDERYHAVAELKEASVHSCFMKRSATWNRKHLDASLSLSLEERAAKSRGEVNVEEMTSMERVNYLRGRVGDLMSAPLMRLLKGATPVTSPVVRTNVFKKNPNFKRALELFEFLEAYRKPGYRIISKDADAQRMECDFRQELCEAIALEAFIARMNSDPAIRSALEENFIRDNELAEQERIRQEEERERAVQARIEAARAEEIAIREAEIAKREEIIAQRDALLLEHEEEINALKDALKAAETAHEQELAALKSAHAEELSSLREEHAAAVDQLRLDMDSAQKRHDEELIRAKREGEAALKRECERLENEHGQTLSREMERAQSQLDRQEKNWKARLDGQRAEMKRIAEKNLSRQRRESELRINALNRELDACRKKLQRLEADPDEGTAAARIFFWKRTGKS